MFRDRDLREVGPNSYVPAMQYSNSVNTTQPQMFNLGTPAASDDDLLFTALAANSAANTETDTTAVTAPYTFDAKYGRTLIYTVSGDPGATGGTVEMRGWDYLNQPMVERISGANGATAIIYGKKAFKRIKSAKIITASTNAVTYKIGTGTRLGLPYKGDVSWAKEAGVMVPIYNRNFWLGTDRSAALAIAGGSTFVRSPTPGYVATLEGIPSGGGSTTNPVITVELGNVAIVGLTVTVDTDTQTRVTDAPTTVGYNANNRFVSNGLIELVGAAAAGAGADFLGVEISPTQFTPADTTDAATATTGDPRGTYDPLTAPAGTEIIVGMLGDNAVNTSNNGGLHGIRHYFA